MTRGKPCPEQLDLSASLDDVSPYSEPGTGLDTRNYGCVEGIPEARELFSQYLGVSPSEILVQGNSSLALMHDTIVQAMLKGFPESETPWSKIPNGIPTMICPVPGYDRHFAICERYGIDMVRVSMTDDGPIMDEVEALVRHNPRIKGIWCVPKYSNPTGIVYSDKVVDRLARMQTAAPDFRIFWDNAYAVHHLDSKPAPLKNIFTACLQKGSPNRPLLFGSTSKITLPDAGVAMVGGSQSNIRWLTEALKVQTIGLHKMNQMRHVRFLRDMPTILEHMARHAKILKPKFDVVLEILDRELGGSGLARCSQPRGGYFISVDVVSVSAKNVVALAREQGVYLTPAGTTFPYHSDPLDTNIRIAPSFPSIDELRRATEIFAGCVKYAAAGKK